MTSGRRAGILAGVAVLVVLAFGPWIGGFLNIDTSFLSEVLLTAIAALGVNLLLGYTGLPIFGNAALFGLGAYGAGLAIKDFHAGFAVALLVGVAAAFVGALIIAPFLLRRRNIYFGLLSLAFGQVFYFIAYRYSDVTGGEDGMAFTRPALNLGPIRGTVTETMMYYITYGLFVLAIVSFWLIVRSPFGQTLVAIKQNELRVRYLGLNTDRFILVGILIAALYGGLGGALYGLLLRFAFPLLLDWHQSGDFVLMTMLGGAGTIFGPLVGAIIFVIGKDIISTITPAWEIFLGAFFIACVLGFPKGILGSIGDAIARRRAPAEPNETAP
ncbi:MAG: branched-chain amino acid ABC transporter permease [Candidatus Lustribacter sp.]|jgi:branched-chain amino acid transport system permease protein